MQNQAFLFYSENIKTLEKQIDNVKKKIFFLYISRLILFLLVFVFIILYINSINTVVFLFFAVACFISFLFVVKRNLVLDNYEKFLSFKLKINRDEVNALNHTYSDRENGDKYNHLNPHLVADFDIFGDGSLYQYINRSATHIGKQRFAENLTKSNLNIDNIIQRQQAIKELSIKNELVQNFQARGMFITESGNELSNLHEWLNESDEKVRQLQLLAYLIPILIFLWITLVVFGVMSINSLAIPFLISLSIVGANRKRIGKAHNRLSNTAKIFEKYYVLIKQIEDEQYESSLLNDIKSRLTNNNVKASLSLKRLFKLLNTFDTRLNIFASFVLNALLLFDIHVYCRLAKWKRQHKGLVGNWFQALADFDSLIGLATFAFNNQDNVAYPTLIPEGFSFQAEEMGHPLINPSVRVNNSIAFGGRPSVIIVTGANMAGKSTFLRTLSVNLVLAMNGAPVCAKSFAFTPCDIMSSIKIQDSLSNNESYFYAELVRIKEVLDHVILNPHTLVVLDEILRGTNTKDKQLGSLGLLEKLIAQKSIVIIATHDLVIGELEKKYPDIVKNYCFEVELTNDQLIFDYKLKNGISQKLNASFLMMKMGIIE